MTVPGQRRMYLIDALCRVDGGYAPVIIIEDDATRYPIGNHENPCPYVWGPTLEDAKREAAFRNVSEFGLEPEDQLLILSSHSAALDAAQYPSVLDGLNRDGESTIVHMHGFTMRAPIRPVHTCAEPEVTGTVYYLIRHADENGDDWTEDFLTRDWWAFTRRFAELTSEGTGITSAEYLIGGDIVMGGR